MRQPRRSQRIEIGPLPDRDDARAVSTFVDAFSNYPTTHWIVAPAPQPFDTALAALFGFFVAARRLRGEGVIGAQVNGALAGVALVSDPEGPPSPPELARRREALWADLGARARARYEAYGAAGAAALATAPKHGRHRHLNLLGVRWGAQGHGLGGRLVEYLRRDAATVGAGLSTTTEDAANLAFYRRHGFVRIGEAPLAPGIHVWALAAPSRPT